MNRLLPLVLSIWFVKPGITAAMIEKALETRRLTWRRGGALILHGRR